MTEEQEMSVREAWEILTGCAEQIIIEYGGIEPEQAKSVQDALDVLNPEIDALIDRIDGGWE